MNKINELFFTKFNNTPDARSVKEKRKKMVQPLSEREELSEASSAAPKKHREHFTLRFSVRRAFCLLFVGTKSRRKITMKG